MYSGDLFSLLQNLHIGLETIPITTTLWYNSKHHLVINGESVNNF